MGVTVDGARLSLVGRRHLAAPPLEGVELVIACPGAFRNEAAHFEPGARKLVVSAPVKDGGAANIVHGMDRGSDDPARHRIVTAASCTANCLAPLVRAIHGAIGIRHGSIATIHDVTDTQPNVERPARDPRRARSPLNSPIPTTRGSAAAITPGPADHGNHPRAGIVDAPSTMVVNGTQRTISAGHDNGMGHAHRLAHVALTVEASA